MKIQPDEKQIRELLSKVPYPGFSRDIVSFGVLRGVTIGSEITLQLVIATNDTAVAKKLRESILTALSEAKSLFLSRCSWMSSHLFKPQLPDPFPSRGCGM